MFSLFSFVFVFVEFCLFLVCVFICYCIFTYFHFLEGSLWSLVGRLDVLGSAWGAVGAFLWALEIVLRVLGSSLGGRWEYLGVLVGSRGLPGRSSGRPWGCLGIFGGTLGVPGCSWGLLGRLRGGSCGVLGESLSGPSAPYATHTDVSACSVFRCSCVTLVTQRNSVNPAEARAHQTLCTAMF